MYFFFVKIAPFAYLKLIELKLAYRYASKLKYADIMRLAHSSNLPVPALVEFKTGDGAVFDLSDFSDFYGKSSFSVKVY